MTIVPNTEDTSRSLYTSQLSVSKSKTPSPHHGLALQEKHEWWKKYEPQKSLLSKRNYLIVKRALDLSLVILAMPIIGLVLAICALLIKLESPSGPVLFKQLRTGKGGRRFEMFKFRTMVPNAEEMKKEMAALNELKWPDFKITDDPRITRVGRLLRKTSLDELPQMFNILRGDMSLVGPRPTFFDPKNYELWHTERLDVIPGLTGLWQITGRGKVVFDERVRLDIAYIDHRCLSLDLIILVKTVGAVIQQRGAH